MNIVIMKGRLTRDPEVRYSQGQNPIAIARFTLAIDRPKRDGQEQTADFPSIVAFGKNGEFAEKYLCKGMAIIVTGRLQTGSYTDNDGKKVYTTDVVADHFEFCESKKSDGSDNSMPGFMNVPDDMDLPFAQPSR